MKCGLQGLFQNCCMAVFENLLVTAAHATCLVQGGMQQDGLALQQGWGALEAQQALLRGGQAMGMGLAPSGLGEGTIMQVGL